MHEYTFKSIRTGPGMENDTFRGTLVCDGKPVGVVEDWGTGGDFTYTNLKGGRFPEDILADLRARGTVEWREYLARDGKPVDEEKMIGNGIGLEDIFIGNLISQIMRDRDRQKLLRKATRQTVFVLDGDDPEWAYRCFPQRVEQSRALEALRQPKYAGKHPRVLNGVTGEWEPLEF